VPARTGWQSLHEPQPLSLQTRAAAKAMAAFDRPEPGGPTKSQEWTICCEELSLFAALIANLSLSTTSLWPTRELKTLIIASLIVQ